MDSHLPYAYSNMATKYTILARNLAQATTSANSGAIWGPFLSNVDKRLQQWSYETLQVLQEQAERSASGIDIVSGLGAQWPQDDDLWWVSKFLNARPSKSVPPAYGSGWDYTVPIIDMPRYLSYLTQRVLRLGGAIRQSNVTSLLELHAGHVVLCAGLGSKGLAGDATLTTSRGQLVVVENPGIQQFFAERGDGPSLTYILPQRRQVVLGGTAEDDSTDPSPNDEITNEIIERCSAIDSRLKAARVLGVRVGF